MSVNRIVFGAASGGSINVTGSVQTLQIPSVNGLSVTSTGAVKNIMSTNWTSAAAIMVPFVGSISIKGSATFTLDARSVHSIHVGGTLQGSTITLSSGGTLDLAMLSAGSITDSTINAAGSLGMISAVMLVNSKIEAGIGTLAADQALPATASDFADPNAFIGGVMLRKAKGVVSDVNSTIAAATINHLSLSNIQYANGGKTFGVGSMNVKAFTAINPVNGKMFTFKKLASSTATAAADFAGIGLNPRDFVIQIV